MGQRIHPEHPRGFESAMYERDEVAHLTSCSYSHRYPTTTPNKSHLPLCYSSPTLESTCFLQQLALFPLFADPPPPACRNQTFLGAGVTTNVLDHPRGF